MSNHVFSKYDSSISSKRISNISTDKTRISKSPVELIHENMELREQLRVLNTRLNELLETKQIKKKPISKMGSPRNILSLSKKQLKHNKSEEKTLKKRVEVVSNPDYSINLQISVQTLHKKLEALTNKNIAYKKQEKMLDRKIEELKVVDKNLGFDSELVFLQNQKIELEELIKKKEENIGDAQSNIEKMKKRVEDLGNKLIEYEKIVDEFKDNTSLIRYRSLESLLNKNKKFLNQTERFYNTQLTNLNLQLTKLQSSESRLSQKYELSYKTLGKHMNKIRAFSNLSSLQNSPSPRPGPFNLTTRVTLGKNICYSP